MSFVLQSDGGLYVADMTKPIGCGMCNYTASLRNARRYPTRDAAERDSYGDTVIEVTP
jgi:hypothetical protein